MLKQKRFAILAAGALLMAGTLSAQGFRARSAQFGPGFGGGPGPRGGMMGPMMAEMLDLTPEQEEAIQAIREAASTEAEALKEDAKAGREAMQAAIETNNIAEIENLAAQQGEVHGQLLAIHAKSRAEMWALLTPEQQETAASFRDRMKQRFGHRRGRFGDRRGGAGPGGPPSSEAL